MIVVQKDIRKTKVIFYNQDFRPKVKMYCSCTDEAYDPEVDENSFYIYELPEQDVRQKLKDKSDRWKLYGVDTKPLDIQIESSTGSLTWQKFYPWTYKKVSYASGEDENGKQITKFKYAWTEHTPVSKKGDLKVFGKDPKKK